VTLPVYFEDRKLAKRLQKGDERAFGAFFDDYFPRLYRFALARLGGDRDATKEIVQGALSRALQGIGRYRGEAALFTWLCTICRNEISDWARRNKKYREHILLTEDFPDLQAVVDSLAASESNNPEIAQQKFEMARLVQVALDQLPTRYGDALEWKYIEGHSVKEIARRMNISGDAAQSLLARARTAFEEIYRNLVQPLMAQGNQVN
jgi:RNA polymerase sigma-70 factor (ECF subfamily)